MEQKLPEKNTPSTIANAINLCAKDVSLLIHLKAHSAFFLIQLKFHGFYTLNTNFEAR